MELKGIIEQGAGQGAFFTSLEWVIEQFEKGMGFKPFPGTLNVRVPEEDLPTVEAFFAVTDFDLVPDNPEFCSASVKRVRVNGIPAAVVIPSEDVRVHDKNLVEIMAGCHVKETLSLNDGDWVTISDAAQESRG